jgi:cytochrome c biogenesis protein
VERLALATWRLLSNVTFAVVLIILIAVAGLIGTLVSQIEAGALRDPGAYATEMAAIHQRYDPLVVLGIPVGPRLVDFFERLGFYHVFSTWWFATLLTVLLVSIVVCTLDRLPRLWRGVREVRVTQPPEFFDPRLPHRASLVLPPAEAASVTTVLRGRRYVTRSGEGSAYGDRNQYFKLATLITHLGLILFLVGAAVTGFFGFETVLFVGDGQTLPVQPVGTPHNLIVKNLGFEAPLRPDGSFADFRTDLAVYQDGRQIARKTIRVNDPLNAGGYVFHQNTFGPAADLRITAPDGRLAWRGPILLAGQVAGSPQGFITIPGSPIGLALVLTRDAGGTPELALQGIAGDASGANQTVFLGAVPVGGSTDPSATAGYTITWEGTSAFSGMVVKRDPGVGIIWAAFILLIAGLILTFYFPRRRVWARFDRGHLQLAMLADRYVDADREFGQLLDDLRRAGATG